MGSQLAPPVRAPWAHGRDSAGRRACQGPAGVQRGKLDCRMQWKSEWREALGALRNGRQNPGD
jgi:hypothetical protein